MFTELTTSQSILDYLNKLFPGIDNIKIITLKPKTIDNKAAKALFGLWKDEDNKIDDKTFKNSNLSIDEIDYLEKEGLITVGDDKLTITNKGSEVIKTMILGDDRSSFKKEKDKKDISLESAIDNTKVYQRRRLRKTASQNEKKGNWYRRNSSE